MHCLEASEWMSLRLDGELPEDKAVALDEHVATCPSCCMEWNLMQRTSALFGDVPLAAPSPVFAEQVMTRIHRRSARLVVLRGILTLSLGLIVVATAAGMPLRVFSALTSAVSINPSVVSTCAGLITCLVNVAGTLARAMGLVLGAVYGSHYLIILGYLLVTGGLVLCWLRLIAWPNRVPVPIHSTARSTKP